VIALASGGKQDRFPASTTPHICVLHDIGLEGDTDFLVMELVEGETLARRLTRGRCPLAEVLKYGAQIADALNRALHAGVIHRTSSRGT
jgi:serine/threonine protein kinase